MRSHTPIELAEVVLVASRSWVRRQQANGCRFCDPRKAAERRCESSLNDVGNCEKDTTHALYN